MRLIGALQGYAAFRESVEEYLPKRGVIQQEMIALVVGRYNFQGFPRLPPGTPPQPLSIFTSGKFPEEPSFAISQLAMTLNGDIAVAVTTEQADLVLNDLCRLLDEGLGFRLGSAGMRKSYLSNIVVEFDDGFDRYIEKLGNMIRVINHFRPGKPEFNVKRLAFGVGDISQTNDPLLSVEESEFLIERRQGSPYESNRYYCSAPMSTTDHIRVLEQIEAIARGSPN
jgi:hypothetical protein